MIDNSEYETLMKKIIKTAFKRPNLLQRYIREDNEVFLLLNEILSEKRNQKPILYIQCLQLLRSCYIMNVDKTIRKKPMKYGNNQYQTIIEEREKVMEDIRVNRGEQMIFIDSVCQDNKILNNIIKTIIEMKDQAVYKELKRLIKAIAQLGKEEQQMILMNMIIDIYQKKEINCSDDINELLLDLMKIITFAKSQRSMTIDSSLDQYLN